MLVNLHVKNLAIIEEIEVDFSENLNVLTGETGAGKSIIIGSINLALGGKVSRDMIRSGAEYAVAELLFHIENQEQRQSLEELGIDCSEDEVLITRRLTASRSINRINGESVTLAQIRRAASCLIDIHGQNEQQSLLHKAKHREILDRYAREELSDLLLRMEEGYKVYQQLLAEKAESEVPEEERLREISFMEYELEEIRSAALREGEEEELAEEYRRLSNAGSIAEGLGEIYAMTGQSSSNISEQLGCCLRIANKLSGYDEQLESFTRQLSDIDSLISDLNREINNYMDDFETDGERLEQVEKRLDEIRRIKAKYGSSTGQIREYADGLQSKLKQYQEYELYRSRLEEKLVQKEAELESTAEQISEIRKRSAAVLQREIIQALQDLNFLQVQFEIQVRPLKQFSGQGKDEVEFMISTNPGEDKKPIGQAASGGELSRIKLAVKAVLAQHDRIPTLIFDEIDVGISGRTAQSVAEKLAYIAGTHQVICISHLAQIAAMADAHYLIEKKNENRHTRTEIRLLRQEEPVQELARILGGAQITEAVLESAREMKRLAEDVKKNFKSVSIR